MNIAGFGNLFACYCAFDPVGGRWQGSKVIPLLLCLCFHVGMRGSIQFDSAINTCVGWVPKFGIFALRERAFLVHCCAGNVSVPPTRAYNPS